MAILYCDILNKVVIRLIASLQHTLYAQHVNNSILKTDAFSRVIGLVQTDCPYCIFYQMSI